MTHPINRLLKQKLILSIILIFVSVINVYASNTDGVLITAKGSKFTKIDIIDLRRLFLGLSITEASGIKQPVINICNREIHQSFLKYVLRMTEKGYKRKIVKRIFRQGADKIIEIDKEEVLIKYLIDHPGYVSYMSEKQASKYDGIRVVQKLW